jgi:hypothetical protein
MRASATPGTCFTFASSLFANSRLAATSGPRIWMSTGAGAPKLRIWLTMSAGRNENVTPGNWRGSSSRMRLT